MQNEWQFNAGNLLDDVLYWSSTTVFIVVSYKVSYNKMKGCWVIDNVIKTLDDEVNKMIQTFMDNGFAFKFTDSLQTKSRMEITPTIIWEKLYTNIIYEGNTAAKTLKIR